MPFPIIRTPFVVQSEIISLLEPNEISKNVLRLLKGHFQQRELLGWRLHLTHSREEAIITLEGEEDGKEVLTALHISELDDTSKPKPIETSGYKRGFSLNSIDLYFEDQVMGTKMIVDYVTGLFNLDVYGLAIDTTGICAIEWINNRQRKMLESFKLLKIPRYNAMVVEASDYDYVLRNARASDYIILDDMVPDNYRFDGILGPVNHLSIDSDGHWVTLDNLINFDIVKIKINGSRLSASDVHSFLRHWRAGGSHRMTQLKLFFETVRNFENLEEELEEIEPDDFSDEDEWDGGYSIQRNDGVKAVIDFDIHYFIMTVLPPREII
ncbi:hypothetical protein B9Z55_015786 [Caenorhabditis nigoni]|uniref:Sdz-33 F-box domain-containing protein n=1 Tax=Caenorhabditis nigoni TaxID=1611254 RepID=A0A2G5UC37_9PELO|nr:hypothetical protein B9Z55_015786 [Caenorhabditis nigoni]